MAVYRFLFAPVLLAVAVWAGPGDRHAGSQPGASPAAAAVRSSAAAVAPAPAARTAVAARPDAHR